MRSEINKQKKIQWMNKETWRMKVKGEGEVSQSRREKCFGLINDVFTPTVNILWIKHHLSNLEIPRETSNWVMKLKYVPYTARSVASCFQPLNVFCFLIPFKCHPCSEATWVIFNFVCISYSLTPGVSLHVRCASVRVCMSILYVCILSTNTAHTKVSLMLLGPSLKHNT